MVTKSPLPFSILLFRFGYSGFRVGYSGLIKAIQGLGWRFGARGGDSDFNGCYPIKQISQSSK